MKFFIVNSVHTFQIVQDTVTIMMQWSNDSIYYKFKVDF